MHSPVSFFLVKICKSRSLVQLTIEYIYHALETWYPLEHAYISSANVEVLLTCYKSFSQFVIIIRKT